MLTDDIFYLCNTILDLLYNNSVIFSKNNWSSMKVIISIKHIQVAFLYIRTLTWKIQLQIIAFIDGFNVFGVRVIMFNATFNNISVISPGRSVLFVEDFSVPKENHWAIARQWQIEYISPFAGIELTTLVVIGTGCISNYYTITTTTVGLCYYFQEWY